MEVFKASITIPNFVTCCYMYLCLNSNALPQPPPVHVVLKPNDLADLGEDDLVVEIVDEYDPLVPNNYELIIRERREQQEKARDEEVNYVLVHV